MKLFQRFYRATFILFCISSSMSLHAMVMDNRYFPWLPYVYNGTDHRHGCLSVEPFFISANSAWQVKPSVRDKEYGYPNLQGNLDYVQVAQALMLDGQENPIPAQWQWIQKMPVDMSGSFEGQGLALQGYVPVHNHVGFGASLFFLRLVAQANLTAAADTVRDLNLAAAGNQAQFDQLTKTFESMVGTQDGFWDQTGVGDIDLYIRAFDVQEYVYWCRKIDTSCTVGLLIPTGVQSAPNFIGSVPFGGDGFWGWYFNPALEVELKEDWKAGIDMRITKRFAKTVEHRMSILNANNPYTVSQGVSNAKKDVDKDADDKTVNKILTPRRHNNPTESNLFAPVSGPLYINPGATLSVTPYFALENIREGLGLLGKYSYIIHQVDNFRDMREMQVPFANFTNMRTNSTWVQEYATLELLYDLGFKHEWSYKPLCTLTWDIPLNTLGSRGASKTTRVSLGLMVDF